MYTAIDDEELIVKEKGFGVYKTSINEVTLSVTAAFVCTNRWP